MLEPSSYPHASSVSETEEIRASLAEGRRRRCGRCPGVTFGKNIALRSCLRRHLIALAGSTPALTLSIRCRTARIMAAVGWEPTGASRCLASPVVSAPNRTSDTNSRTRFGSLSRTSGFPGLCVFVPRVTEEAWLRYLNGATWVGLTQQSEGPQAVRRPSAKRRVSLELPGAWCFAR